MRRAVILTALVLASLPSFSTGTAACQPITYSATFRLCSVPVATDTETVVAIRLERGLVQSDYDLPNNNPGNFTDVGHTRVVDVFIEQGTGPLYVVMSSLESVIWNFSGHVERVSRVVAMGSEFYGADHVAVQGISKDKVSFPPPSAKELATDSSVLTTCGFVPHACHPGHYFYHLTDDSRPGHAVVRQVHLWNILNSHGAFTSIPAGHLPEGAFRLPKFVDTGSVRTISIPSMSLDQTPVEGLTAKIHVEDLVRPQ